MMPKDFADGKDTEQSRGVVSPEQPNGSKPSQNNIEALRYSLAIVEVGRVSERIIWFYLSSK